LTGSSKDSIIKVIVVIPSKRRRCGPGFDSRQVHQKCIV